MEEKPTLASIAEYLAIVAICFLVVIVLWHVYIIVRDTVFGSLCTRINAGLNAISFRRSKP